MKVINKLIAIILGLALIALIGLAAVSLTEVTSILQLDIFYEYTDLIPDWGNLIILYVVSVLKIIIVLLVLFGAKKASRIAILPLIIVVADYGYRNLDVILDARAIFSSFVVSDILNAIRNYGVDNLLELGSFIFVGIFFLSFFIIALLGRTNRIGARIVLLLFGLAPAGLLYGTYINAGVYLPDLLELATIGFEYGLYLVMGIVICISHFRHKGTTGKRRKKKEKSVDYPKLPLNQLTK